jgi:ankyrin repeat protein
LVGAGRTEVMQRTVEQGFVSPDMAVPDDAARYAWLVHAAVRADAVGLLRWLVCERGADPNRRNGRGQTPLLLAIVRRKEACALFLIQEAPGCDLAVPLPSQKLPPLTLAVRTGVMPVIKALVARGVDLEARTEKQATALAEAAGYSHEDVALYFLAETGARWDACGEGYLVETAAMVGLPRLMAAALGVMRAAGVGVARVATHMRRGAAMAIMLGKLASLPVLVEEGFDVTRPLGPASPRCEIYNHKAGIDWLVRVYTRLRDKPQIEADGTALHLAAQFGHADIVEWLVGAGADPRKPARYSGSSALKRPSAVVAAAEHPEVATYLQEQEAVWDARERDAAVAEVE